MAFYSYNYLFCIIISTIINKNNMSQFTSMIAVIAPFKKCNEAVCLLQKLQIKY